MPLKLGHFVLGGSMIWGQIDLRWRAPPFVMEYSFYDPLLASLSGIQQGDLQPLQAANELLLFPLAQGLQPHLLMLVHNRAKIPGDLPAGVGQLD